MRAPSGMIEQVRQAAPAAPLIVVSSAKQWEWEEDAYLLGVFHIITKPIRAKLLNNLLERAFHEQDQKGSGRRRRPGGRCCTDAPPRTSRSIFAPWWPCAGFPAS